MSPIFYTLLSIIILYFLFAFIREPLVKIIKVKICAICAAVSLTWLGSLVLKFFGYPIDNLIIGILMGGSVVGIMYKTEGYFKKKNWSFWFVRLVIIIGGFSLIYFLLQENYLNFLITLGLVLILSFITLLAQLKPAPAPNYDGLSKDAIDELKKKLENCCG